MTSPALQSSPAQGGFTEMLLGSQLRVQEAATATVYPGASGGTPQWGIWMSLPAPHLSGPRMLGTDVYVAP